MLEISHQISLESLSGIFEKLYHFFYYACKLTITHIVSYNLYVVCITACLIVAGAQTANIMLVHNKNDINKIELNIRTEKVTNSFS